MNKLWLFIALIFLTNCNNKPSNISVISKNEAIKLSDAIITIQTDPNSQEIVIWDGKLKNDVPNYGGMGAKFFIRYKEVRGEFLHAKFVANEPMEYQFIFNQNQDSSIFVQVIIDPKDKERNHMSFSERVRLK